MRFRSAAEPLATMSPPLLEVSFVLLNANALAQRKSARLAFLSLIRNDDDNCDGFYCVRSTRMELLPVERLRLSGQPILR